MQVPWFSWGYISFFQGLVKFIPFNSLGLYFLHEFGYILKSISHDRSIGTNGIFTDSLIWLISYGINYNHPMDPSWGWCYLWRIQDAVGPVSNVCNWKLKYLHLWKRKKTSLKIPLKRKYVTRWWFQPIWKNMSQNGFIFPKVWGEHKKCFSCHHPGELAGGVPFLESNSSHPKKRWMAWKTRSCWNRRGAFLGNKARWCWWKKSQTTTVWMYKTPWK